MSNLDTTTPMSEFNVVDENGNTTSVPLSAGGTVSGSVSDLWGPVNTLANTSWLINNTSTPASMNLYDRATFDIEATVHYEVDGVDTAITFQKIKFFSSQIQLQSSSGNYPYMYIFNSGGAQIYNPGFIGIPNGTNFTIEFGSGFDILTDEYFYEYMHQKGSLQSGSDQEEMGLSIQEIKSKTDTIKKFGKGYKFLSDRGLYDSPIPAVYINNNNDIVIDYIRQELVPNTLFLLNVSDNFLDNTETIRARISDALCFWDGSGVLKFYNSSVMYMSAEETGDYAYLDVMGIGGGTTYVMFEINNWTYVSYRNEAAISKLNGDKTDFYQEGIEIVAPVTVGSTGQVLVSNGDGGEYNRDPRWKSLSNKISDASKATDIPSAKAVYDYGKTYEHHIMLGAGTNDTTSIVITTRSPDIFTVDTLIEYLSPKLAGSIPVHGVNTVIDPSTGVVTRFDASYALQIVSDSTLKNRIRIDRAGIEFPSFAFVTDYYLVENINDIVIEV